MWRSFSSLCRSRAQAVAATESTWLQRAWYAAETDRNPQKVLSDEVCTGANIFVEGTDPTLQPDEEYPEWLWELSKPMKSIKQIRQQVEELGGYEDLPYDDFTRLMKKERREAIRAHNTANRKK